MLGFRTTKQTDIISTLVSIYDSKDIFVKELQVLLAKRLLEIKNNDYEAEVCIPKYHLVICLTAYLRQGTLRSSSFALETRLSRSAM
jgi:hypothetical protein